MKCLRTPDERFEGLPDWSYAPNYIDDLDGYAGMRMHYVDEGPSSAEHTFLCLHGEPTWSYLYRRMIPGFLASGGRVVVPDLFGFGRSDKPAELDDYSFHFHRNSLLRLIERLDLQNITLVVQDWGGVLGLTLPVDIGDRVSRLLIMNTAIATGKPASAGFNAWRDYCKNTPDLAVGGLIAKGTPHLTPAEIAAYDAPFPSADYKAGVRIFPELVMTDPGMEGIGTSEKALRYWQNFDGPVFMAIGMKDPVLGPPTMMAMHKLFKTSPPPLEIADGGHFVQEWGEEIVPAALEYFDSV